MQVETEAEHSEEALRASELRYRRLFETAKDGILILDAKTGQITDVNPFLVNLLGYSHDEFIGTPLWEIGPFKDIKECKLAFVELQDKEYIRYESLPLETKDGRSIAVEFVSNVYGLSGGTRVIQCNIRDITARKRTEEALRESEERFRLLVDGAKDHAIFLLDPDGRVVSWNSGAQMITGYTAPEIIGRHISCFYAPEDVELGKPERLLKAAAEHGVAEDEGWRVRKDGSQFWAEVAVSALLDESGHVRGYSKVTRDITARKQAEENLRTSEARLAAIIGSAMDAIVTVDKDQRIVVFNAAAEKIFGCPAAEAIGQALECFIPERFREAHDSHVRHFGSTGATSRSMHSPGTLYGRRANGEEFPLEATISQATIGGEILYTVILRDMTQRKQTEAALMRSEKLATVGRLAATVAHEINNPLAAVINLLYLAEHNPSLDEAAREHLRMAGAEIMRAAQIARQTLSFSKGGAAVSRFRPADVLESVLALLESKLRNKAVVCEKEFSGHAEICSVESEIRQIFWNLLSNSLDAVAAGGRIKLRVSPSRRHGGAPGVRVTVADNGSGISAEHMPHLFEPFFTTKETGNGLGLWITSEIVKKHGGSLRVRSRNGTGERTGSVFSVFLPADWQDDVSSGRARRARQGCDQEEVLAEAAAGLHCEPAALAHRH